MDIIDDDDTMESTPDDSNEINFIADPAKGQAFQRWVFDRLPLRREQRQSILNSAVLSGVINTRCDTDSDDDDVARSVKRKK